MATKTLKTLHITMGLPGAGKTSWATEFVKSKGGSGPYGRNPNAYHLEHDANRYSRDIDSILSDVKKYHSTYDDLIIDTLVISSAGIKTILTKMKPSNYDQIIIHFWEPDVEACIINDHARRELSAELTIRNAVLEKPNLVNIKNHLNYALNGPMKHSAPAYRSIPILLEEHKTYRKEDWKIFWDEVKDQNDYGYSTNPEAVTSDRWSEGGSWADCWGGGGDIGEEDPCEFTEFKNIMNRACPGISEEQYQEVWNTCVDKDSDSDSDYYGGCAYYGFWSFKVKHLYETLVKLGLYKLKL
jgi:hypothetical protein